MGRALVDAAIAVGLSGCAVPGVYRGRARWQLTLGEETTSRAEIARHEVVGAAAGEWSGSRRVQDLAATTCIRWKRHARVELTCNGRATLERARIHVALWGPIAFASGETTHAGSFLYVFEGSRL